MAIFDYAPRMPLSSMGWIIKIYLSEPTFNSKFKSDSIWSCLWHVDWNDFFLCMLDVFILQLGSLKQDMLLDQTLTTFSVAWLKRFTSRKRFKQIKTSQGIRFHREQWLHFHICPGYILHFPFQGFSCYFNYNISDRVDAQTLMSSHKNVCKSFPLQQWSHLWQPMLYFLSPKDFFDYHQSQYFRHKGEALVYFFCNGRHP